MGGRRQQHGLSAVEKGRKQHNCFLTVIDLCALSRGPPRGPAASHNTDALGYNLTPRARPHDAVLPRQPPQRGRFDCAPHAEEKGESNIVREVAGPIGIF